MRTWLQTNRDVEVQVQVHENFSIAVPKGTIGFVIGTEVVSGSIFMMSFPQGDINVYGEDLEPVDMPDLEDALTTIAKYEGHHARSASGQYQFNIKVHNYRLPEGLNRYSDEWVSNTFWDIMSNELKSYVEQLKKDIDWIDQWHTAGANSGWLVVSHYYKVSSESLSSEVQVEQWKLDDLASPISHDRYNSGEAYLEDMSDLEEQLEQKQLEVADMALELDWIQNKCTVGVHQIEEYLATWDAWKPYMEVPNVDSK